MSNLPQRKQLRLRDYDYSQAGQYFITICVKDRHNILCDVGGAAYGDPQIPMTQTGKMVLHYLQNIGKVYENVILDCSIIMPNHIHCIIALQNDTGSPWAATPTTIPVILNSFKTITSKKYGQTLWQRGYYEHIIRNEIELQRIRQYITENPAKWQEDMYFI
mgnify:CR=1 FL=1